MDYTIRPMTMQDFDAVTHLWENAAGIGLTISDSRPHLSAYLERNPDLSLVAMDAAGALVGVVLCGHDGARGYVRHLAVAPPARGRGIARDLLAGCRTALGNLGIQKCTAHIFTENASGLQFWHQVGWRERADLKVMQVVLSDDWE